MSMWGRLRHERDGASAVEFALVLIPLVLLVFGTIQFGLAYNRQQSFHAAAREAGRLLSVGYDLGEIDGAVRNIAAGTVDPAHVQITVIDPCTGGAGLDLVAVRVRVDPAFSGQYAVQIPLIPVVEPTFESVATFRCEVQP